MTITLGWWLLPLAYTVVSFVIFLMLCRFAGSPRGRLARIGAALIITTPGAAFAWGLWALIQWLA